MTAVDDEIITGKHAIPPTDEEVPLEVLGHRLALRLHEKRLAEIETTFEKRLDAAVDRLIAKFTRNAAGIALGVMLTIAGGMFWLAQRFAAIEVNTDRIERLEQHEHRVLSAANPE